MVWNTSRNKTTNLENIIGKNINFFRISSPKSVLNSYQGYLPTNKERRGAALERKRQEYLSFLPQYHRVKEQKDTVDGDESSTFHQVIIFTK